jgi:hypothetical protein
MNLEGMEESLFPIVRSYPGIYSNSTENNWVIPYQINTGHNPTPSELNDLL